MEKYIKESHSVEFKLKLTNNIYEAISAFANSDGGIIYLGVDDNGIPVGVKNSKKLLKDLPNMIRDTLQFMPCVKLEDNNNQNIIIINVNSSSTPIYYNGKLYRRNGSTNQLLKGSELTEFIISKSGKTYDEYIEEDASINDIDLEQVINFKKLAITRLPSIKDDEPIKILEKLGLIKNSQITKACILLFGKNPKKYNISAYTRIGKFTKNNRVVDDDIEGNLFHQLEYTIEILKKKYLLQEEKGINENWTRKVEYEYP
jgi:ATP-dependent DNA helicase RecG